MHFQRLSGFFALLLFCGPILAQDKTKKPSNVDFLESIFKHFDKNKDGKLTASELPPQIRMAMESIDTKSKGSITLADLQSVYQKRITRTRSSFPEFLFKRYDSNGDGKIDAKDGAAWTRFKQFDKNKDGAISPQELAEGYGGRGFTSTRAFDRLDTNKDGKLTQKEAGARWRTYSRYDKNNDGKVTKEEYTAGRQRRPFGPANRVPLVDRIFESADTNKDGELTEKELGARWRTFQRFDADMNGKITKEEFQKVLNRPGGGIPPRPPARGGRGNRGR